MPGWLKGLSICLWLRLWSWSLGSSPILGSCWGVCFSFSLIFSLSLSLSLSLKNKIVIKKQDPSLRCLQDAHLRPIHTSRFIVRGGKIIYHANGYQTKAGGPILISDKRDLNPNTGDTWWFSCWASAFGSGCDPGIPGSSPTSDSLRGACLSFCLCFCLCFSVYL